MAEKYITLPFGLAKARAIASEFGTPIYIYDETGIRQTAQRLTKAFGWAKGYKNYFAVKATPTPAILNILHEEGMGFDCSSRSELLMVERLGIAGSEIFYSSNNTPREDFGLAIKLGATVNIDDLAQVPVFASVLGKGNLSRVAARYNPGNLKAGNDIIGKPTEAKYGMSLEPLTEAFTQLKKLNIQEFGLHTMVASNELSPEYFAETAELLLDAAQRVKSATGVSVSFINLGGGFGLNYELSNSPLDVNKASKLIEEVMKKNKNPVQLYTENGRYVTGPHGYLLTKVRYVMNKYKTFVGVDASMHNLMRPGMYGAYHHISVLGNETDSATKTYDVVGSLCENNDKFAINRKLPRVHGGDYLVIHDAGAHGHAMGFNYNGLLRSAEVLLKPDGKVRLIRRAETTEDYFRTIVWPG